MDDRTADQRSQTMAAVKSAGTSLEKKVIRAFEEAGISSLETYPEDIFGNPDLVDRQRKLAIFVDSCFWHGCPDHCRMPNAHREYWEKKIARNRKRDRSVNRVLQVEGWTVKRIWEHSIKDPTKLRWWVTRVKTLTSE